MKHMVKFTALVCCSLAAASLFADPETGWLRTAADTYDYNDPANWVKGEINGIFGSDLTLEGAQTITFAADTSLANGLTINYKGNFPMTFQSDGSGAKTLTLGGDISEALQGNASAVVTIGSAGDDALVLDLGGENRTITAAATVGEIDKSGILSIPAKIQNGALTINGTKNLKLAGANTYAGGTTIAGPTYVYVNSETAFGTGDVSINAVLSLCADNNLTMTANNTFYMNAGRFAYRSGKTLDIGTGDFVATNSFQFWAEANTLVIHGRIVDKDGKLAPWKLQKWGGNRLDTYSDAVMSDGDKFVIGNGTWYFNGAISGTGFTVDASSATSGTQHFRMQSANTFEGVLSITGGSLYVYADNAGVIPTGSQVSIGEGTYFIGNGAANYISNLMASNGVTTDSVGTLCFNSNDSGDIDLTNYPDLVLGAWSNTRTYSGIITWPDVNPIRLGGGDNQIALIAQNAIPHNCDIEILGKIQFNALNETDGTVHVTDKASLVLGNANGAAAQLPNAHVIVGHQGTIKIEPGNDFNGVSVNKLTLRSSTLTVNGAKGKTINCKINELELEPAAQYGGIPQFSWSQNSSVNLTLRIGKVSRRYPIPLNFQTDPANLGLTESTSGCNIIFEDGSATPIGVEGSSVVPVVPWVRYNGAFLTYDAVKGFQSIPESAMEVYTASQELDATSQVGAHLYAKGSGSSEVAVKFLKETVLTSLRTGYQTKTIRVQTGDDAVIKIPTGAVFEDGNTRPYIEAAIDFGDARGYIFDRQGKAQEFKGLISGTGGLTLAHYGTSNITGANGGPGLVCHFAESTFTGDVHSFTRIDEASQGAFPYGERSGNFYLHGYWLCSNNPISLNGLYGAGYLGLQNGYDNVLFTLGCDGSDGDFDGQINRSKGTFKLTKIGSGRQRFGGECTHNGATTVSAGTLQVDGAFTQSAVTVASGATLAGCGTFGGAVTLADGAKLEVGSAKLGESDAEMTFEGDLTFQGDSAVTFKVLGKTAVATLVGSPALQSGKKLTISLDSKDLKGGEYCLFKSDSALSLSYVRGANCGPLSYRNDGKELWMKKNTSLTITIR